MRNAETATEAKEDLGRSSRASYLFRCVVCENAYGFFLQTSNEVFADRGVTDEAPGWSVCAAGEKDLWSKIKASLQREAVDHTACHTDHAGLPWLPRVLLYRVPSLPIDTNAHRVPPQITGLSLLLSFAAIAPVKRPARSASGHTSRISRSPRPPPPPPSSPPAKYARPMYAPRAQPRGDGSCGAPVRR